jgi:hypothetical protein
MDIVVTSRNTQLTDRFRAVGQAAEGGQARPEV